MEQLRGGYWNLSDEEAQALEYQAMLLDDERFDFRLGAYSADHTIDGYLLRNTYEIGDKHMIVHDAVWGSEHIGDKPHDMLLIELVRTPLFRRLQSIEQLTLGPKYATMPNSMYFSRWEHMWGSVVFVRKMLEGRDDIDDRQKMVLQLRTLLSDAAHTAFSHLGDWMFQGTQGGEDLHDEDLKDVLRVSGLEEMIARHGFTLDETVFPETEDWVECPSPQLCVDRVDYGYREMLRWVAPTIPLHLYLQEIQNPQSIFEIAEDGQLVFRNQVMARMYAAGFSLLPTEHWSHPVHRLQLQLFQSAVRSSVIENVQYEPTHPREAMYGIDNDFYAHFQTWPMVHLQETMQTIGSTQRKIFVQGRRADLNHVFSGFRDSDKDFPAFPDPLKPYTWQSEYFAKPYPPNVEIEEVPAEPAEPLTASEKGLVVNMLPLKARAVDPPVRLSSGEIKPLSQIDPSYSRYLAGQREMMAKAYRATVLMRNDVAQKIVEQHQADDAAWPQLLRRKRNAENLGRIIRETMPSAAANSFDVIREVDDEDIERTRKVGVQGVLFGL
jgi:hypothetical protein